MKRYDVDGCDAQEVVITQRIQFTTIIFCEAGRDLRSYFVAQVVARERWSITEICMLG